MKQLRLKNWKIVVTRARHQAPELSGKIREEGGSPIEFPTIRIAQPETMKPVDDAIRNISSFDWIVFTSKNGVETFLRRALSLGEQPQNTFDNRIAAIGPGTARSLETFGLSADLQPDRFRSEQLADALLKTLSGGESVLLPRSNVSRPVLTDRLKERNVHVNEVHPYHLVPPEHHSDNILEMLKTDQVNLLTFTSSMTVTNFDQLIGTYDLPHLRTVPAACIGPVTESTASDAGYEVAAVADEYTIDGLFDAILELAQ